MKSIPKPTNIKTVILLVITFLLPALNQCNAEVFVDHQRLAQETGCFKCHYMPPRNKQTEIASETVVDPRLKEGAGKWCVSCHDMEAKTLHPTDVTADPDAGLPLEENNQMSCLTCHSPHISSVATSPWVPPVIEQKTEQGYKTYLLTSPNDQGQLCLKCHPEDNSFLSRSMHSSAAFSHRNYAGSESCKKCHADIYQQWEITPHAKMTRRLEQIEDHEQIPIEELGFNREKIVWVLGSHYVNRFVAKASGTLVVLPKIWDINEKEWLPVKDYGWKHRYWLKQCAGCHTTGFSTENDEFIEPGVGCESCHGPGINHIRTGSKEYIVAPKRLSEKRREMICESCHTSGLDNSGEYHFPAGYKPGEDLTKYFSGLTPKPGQSPKNFHGDETYEDRRRQWDFLKSRFLLAKGLTCDYCQNFRNVETKSNSDYLTPDEYCLTCHTDKTDHPEQSPGNNCTVCHQPSLNASGTMTIHDHKFYFKPNQ
ncbi:MAG: multiheme c-type cytochrome [Candidatus Rifleibacteriota bacterium]